jgi:hypothetical protein
LDVCSVEYSLIARITKAPRRGFRAIISNVTCLSDNDQQSLSIRASRDVIHKGSNELLIFFNFLCWAICAIFEMRPALINRACPSARALLWSSVGRVYQPSSLRWRATQLGRTSPVSIRSTSSLRAGHIKLDQNEGIFYVNSKF